MTRSDWWLGLLLVTGLILWHAAMLRYEFRLVGSEPLVLRLDRLTGRVEWATKDRTGSWGRWADQPR